MGTKIYPNSNIWPLEEFCHPYKTQMNEREDGIYKSNFVLPNKHQQITV